MKVMFAAIGSEIVSIEALSAVLKQRGHRCGLAFDRGMFDDKQYFSIPFLARLFDDRRRVVRDILDYHPDLLAFSVFADNFQWCLGIAREVRKSLQAPVVFGGIHPTSAPDICIAEDAVDIVCRGEGEYPLAELADSMEKGAVDYSIPNLWFKKDGRIIKNPPRPLIADLDSLPLIDKSIFERFVPLRRYYLTVTNKGCIAACAYCSQDYLQQWERDSAPGRFYRERSVGSVLAELAAMKTRYRIQRIDIKNNVLSASRAWTIEFCRRYRDEIGLPFRIMGHPLTIVPETARALRDAGCWHVQLGVESLNPGVRRAALGRTETNEEILSAVDAMEQAGLNYSIDIMVGLPGETDADIASALLTFAGKKHLVRASIFWLQYLPGVRITRDALAGGRITAGDDEKINRGLQANYLSTGSVTDRRRRECLLNYQLLFRVLPVAPRWLVAAALRTGIFRLFKYLPQVPVIIAVDMLVSFVKKDHWARYAMFSYGWELARRVRRRLGIGRYTWD